jgi:hypothetical protein
MYRAKVVGHSESEAKVVLHVVDTVGQCGSDVLCLKQTHTKISEEEYIHTAACLDRKRTCA